MTTTTYPVESPERLDTFLSAQLDVTRNQVAQLIKQENVTVDGKGVAKPGLKLRPGQSVTVNLPEPQSSEPQPVEFDVEVLYEDEHLMVINKPSGVTVHPAPSVKEATLVDWLKLNNVRLSTISGEERHGIVHRLDKGTSGAMVIAKTNEAHEALSLQLQDKSMGRYYLAVISPPLKEELTTVEKPIGRSTHNRLKMAHVDHGKSARTMFRKLLLSHDEKQELIACKLFTGRTHQIRVHLETLSRHIAGDHLYGIKSPKGTMARILLHAYILYFTHPATKETMRFSVPMDPVMQEYLDKHFDKEMLDESTRPEYIEHSFSH